MAVLKTTDNDVVVVDEGESLNVQVTLTDVDGSALSAALTTDITFSLYDRDTNSIINSRNDVSVKNVNGGTVTTGGLLDIRLQPADNAIIDNNITAGDIEKHVARVTFTWNDGYLTRTGLGEHEFGVRALPTLTS